MHLLFLGTGAGIPSKSRNVTAIALALFAERGSFWLFDCGEATQHQIIRSPLSLAKLDKVFITHLHGDHIFGLPGLLGSRSFSGVGRPLDLYGPAGLGPFVEAALTASQTHLSYPLEIHEIESGTIFEDDRFTVSCLPLQHRVPSYGYRVVEHDLPGSLNVAALAQLGIPPGPLYGRLKRGEMVRMEDGRTLEPADFVGSPKRGRVITILGDTRPSDNARKLASAADVLVHEATFASEAAELAPTYGHSTAIDAAEAARAAHTQQLVLTHISARYGDNGAHTLLAEARAIFPNTCLAHDLMQVTVGRHADPAPCESEMS